MQLRLFILVLAIFKCISAPVLASELKDNPLVYKTIFGLFLHDRGPTSDRQETGAVDPNWELQFHAPDWKLWHWIGSPSPMLGAIPNFKGDTSVFYAGLSYEISLSNKLTDELTYNVTKNLFVAGGVSAALHNGELHKDPVACEQRSDCGFGYRVLPRLNIELGLKFLEHQALSIYYGHMSHKGVLPGENEGIDHVGLRYHYTFGSLTQR